MKEYLTQTLRVPGTEAELTYRRSPQGRLVALTYQKTTYVRELGEVRILGDGLARMSEIGFNRRCLRHVQGGGQAWVEHYVWDEDGRLVEVDGVQVRRDERGRIVACESEFGRWTYTYGGDHLVTIKSPLGHRRFTRGQDGRPLARHEHNATFTIGYDDQNRRRGLTPPPETWFYDEFGRLWTITAEDGTVLATYLWDGFACLGRIDGPLGDPLAAVFCLDPSGTPVRVITREGLIRIPRDAFGEGLLNHPGVPGLYGGAVYKGHVHLRARSLDPRTGSFDRPDPWHGRADDPRRGGGYLGPLPVEKEPAGPFAICQHDPIGFADPTGEISGWLIFSDFTWSLQHNIASFLGLEFIVNVLLTPFAAIAGARDFFSAFDWTPLSSSDRLGSSGMRIDGLMAARDQAWTYQHIVWAAQEKFDKLARSRVFVPGGPFRPTLYGTVLLAEPNDNDSFLLRGSGNINNDVPDNARPQNWTRSGGRAEPVYPGANVPYFPSGGLHFGEEKAEGPLDGNVRELLPSSTLAFGHLIGSEITLSGTGLSFSGGEWLLIATPVLGAEVIAQVIGASTSGSNTLLELGDVPMSWFGKVDIQTLNGPDPDPPHELPGLDPSSTPNDTLGYINANGIAAPVPYAAGDILRITRIANLNRMVRRIERLECRLQVNTPVNEPALAGGFTVWVANMGILGTADLIADPGGGPRPVLQITTGSLPAVGNLLQVTGGGNQVYTTVDDVDAATSLVRVADDLSALGATANWQVVNRAAQLGTNSAAEADPVITYQSTGIGEVQAAVTSGNVLLEGSGAVTVRQVTGVAYDAIVVDETLEESATDNHVIERFRPTTSADPVHFQQTGVDLEILLQFETPTDLSGARAIQFQRLPGQDETAVLADSAGWSAVTNMEITPGEPGTGMAKRSFASGAGRGPSPTPSQLVAVSDGSKTELAVIGRVTMKIPFLDEMVIGSGSDWRLVPLEMGDDSPHEAEAVTASQVRISSVVDGTTMDMPPLNVGDTLRLAGEDPAATPPEFTRDRTITAINNFELTLVEDVTTAGANIATPANNLEIINLDAFAGLSYQGTRLGDRQLQVRPVPGATTLPVYHSGDDVILNWIEGGSPVQDTYAVAAGGVRLLLALTGGQILPAAGVDFTAENLTRAPGIELNGVRLADFSLAITVDDSSTFQGGDQVEVRWSAGGVAASDTYTLNPAPQFELTLGGGRDLPAVGVNFRAENRSRSPGLVSSVTRQNTRVVRVNPAVAPISVPIPRFAVADRVLVSWDDAGAPGGRRQVTFRVGSIDIITVTLNNTLPFPNNNLRARRRNSDLGTTYQADALIASQATIRPYVGSVRVQMPRMEVGEFVQATFLRATQLVQAYYRVAAVSGTTVTLEGANPLPAEARSLRITRLSPVTPGTGGPWLGINGEGVTTSAGQPQLVAFDVWQPDSITGGRAYVLVNDEQALINVVDPNGTMDLEVTFATAITADTAGATNGQILVAPANNRVAYVVKFSRDAAEENTWLINSPLGSLEISEDLVAAILYQDAPEPADDFFDNTAGGRFHPGSVRVPADPEGTEIDLRQSLTDHELYHTLQSSRWGPLLLAFFPLWIYEGAFELFSDVEQPEFSAYVQAKLETVETGLGLHITNPGSISFGEGDLVQLSYNGNTRSETLGAPAGSNTFRIPASLTSSFPVDETLWIRKEEGGAADTWGEWIPNILQLSTIGGLLNVLSIATYGGLIFLIMKAIRGIARLAADDYEATVSSEGRQLTVSDAASFEALKDASYLTINKDGNTVVRFLVSADPDAGTLSLQNRVSFEGAVQVSRFSYQEEGQMWDWHRYWPATTVGPDRPAAIIVQPLNGHNLELERYDRVTITIGSRSLHTTVTAVPEGGFGIVELEDPVMTGPNGETDLLIAKVGHEDPFGYLDSELLNRMGIGWLKWLHDPYGQLQYRFAADSNSALDKFVQALARLGRYAFGTQSWSILPAFGWVFWDNFFFRSTAHRSTIEQGASEQSGDLYSHTGRLRGQIQYVGDIGRYWFFSNYRFNAVFGLSDQDAPGLRMGDTPRLVPVLDTGGPDIGEPNQGARIDPAVTTPGLLMPDRFYWKDRDIPTRAGATMPDGFRPGNLGWIPPTPEQRRCQGMYVAFSRPGRHRITVANIPHPSPIPGDWIDWCEGEDRTGDEQNWCQMRKSRDAQEHKHQLIETDDPDEAVQRIFYDQDVADVIASAAGQSLPEGGRLRLILRQQAAVQVTPDGNRRYTVTVLRPADGEVVRTEGDLNVVAQGRIGNEAAEISRVYRPDGEGRFGDSSLDQHGVLLPGEIHIPVRLLDIEVVDTVPFRSAVPGGADLVADYDANAVDEIRPGENSFILVPAAIFLPLQLDTVTYPPGTPAAISNLAFATLPESTPGELAGFMRYGGIFRVTFETGAPPEEPADVRLRVVAGTAAANSPVFANVRLMPHFRLILPPAGQEIARGDTLALPCRDMDNNPVTIAADTVSVTPEAGVTATADGTNVQVQVTAGASPGPRVITAADAADANRQARRTIIVV